MDCHLIWVNARNDLEIFIVVPNEARKDDKEGTCNTLEKLGIKNFSKRIWKEKITSKYLAWFGG